MKTIRKTQMQPLEAETLREYADKYNAAMNWVSKSADKYLEYQLVETNPYKGFIVYEVTEKIPQNIEDVLNIHEVSLNCSQCSKYNPTSFNKGECEYCRGALLANDTPCPKFWRAWEEGECWLKSGGREYAKYINELRCTSLYAAE